MSFKHINDDDDDDDDDNNNNNNSTEQSPSCDANRSSASREILRVLWNQKFH